MQMVKKLTLSLLLVWASLLLFMPKAEIYFSLERELAKKGVEINEESIDEHLFGLTLKHATVYVQGIEVATVQEVSLFTLLFYTQINAKELKTDKAIQTMLPADVKKMHVVHSILSPWTLYLDAEGSFGKIEGTVQMKEKLIHLDLTVPKQIEMFRSKLKKGDKGWYYETSF